MTSMKRLLLAALAGGAMLPARTAEAETFTTLHSFAGGADGAYPRVLLYHDDLLYGTTLDGNGTGCGGNGCGTIYQIDPGTGAESVLYGFTGRVDGGNPDSSLVYRSGALLGTTFMGGAIGAGTLFRINIRTGQESVRHQFDFTTGAYPGDLTRNAGELYGTTTQGGDHGIGLVYDINFTTGRTTILHSFLPGSPEGQNPATLIYENGALYGTTFYSLNAGSGSVYKLDCLRVLRRSCIPSPAVPTAARPER